MKLKKVEQINDFVKTVDECIGDVYLTSQYGDKFNLKSKISQYLAIAALLGERGDELELWCDNREDTSRFLNFFYEHPEI